MSRTRTALALVGAAAGAAGAAGAAATLLARRARRRPDAGAGVTFAPSFDREVEIATFDGGSTYAIVRGGGPPIVLCHGVTLSVRTWTYQMETLPGRGHTVVAFDSRGHGRSSCGSAGHDIAHLARDLHGVLEALDLHDAVLVGHSMGGVAVQAFATTFPEVARQRVAGLVLLSTLARPPLRVPGLARRLSSPRVRVPTAAVSRVLERPDLGFLATRLVFGRDPAPSHVELTRRMTLACSPETLVGAPMALVGFDLTPVLGTIDRPTLVVCGTADRVTPLRESRRLASHIPGARLEVVEGGGHMLMLERPRLVDDLIVEFARSLGAVASAGAGDAVAAGR